MDKSGEGSVRENICRNINILADSESKKKDFAEKIGAGKQLQKDGGLLHVGAFAKTSRGKRMAPTSATHHLDRFGEWAEDNGIDIPRLTLESMRHSFATSYLHAGGHVEDLSRLLGHSDINTTYRRYVRPSIDDLQRGMDDVDGAISL